MSSNNKFNIKKFFVSLFNSNKRSIEVVGTEIDPFNPRYIPKQHYNNNQNNNQNNLNQDMLNLEIVIPGHYCSNETLNSKVKDIIRIIGPDKYRQGYWLTQDGKSLNENLILDGYTLLDTKPSEGNFSKANVTKRKGKDIMKGFKPVKGKHEIDDADELDDVDDASYTEQPYSAPIPEHLKPNQLDIQHTIQPKVKPDPLAETKKLLEKATIKQLNINYAKKYGTEPYKPEIITVPLKIEIPYHLDKLNQICELFELDIKTVAQIIFENLRLPEEIILQIITNRLSGHVVQQPQVQQPVNKNQKEIESGISDIDNFLNDFFKA